jgi:hypothetical protein
LDSAAIFDRVVSHAKRSGLFEKVNGMHEPKAAPAAKGLTCAAWVDSVGPGRAVSGLAATTALVVCQVRVYSSMVASPVDAIDPRVFRAVDRLYLAFLDDLDLGGTVLSIDVRGLAGVPMSARAGYVEMDKHMFRVMTLTLPFLVADAWPESY